MNIQTMEKISGISKGKQVSDALLQLKKTPQKKGVDLVNIAKKLSSKKFGKK